MANVICLYAFFFVFLQSFITCIARMMFLRVFQNRNKIKNHYNERFIQMA